MLKRLLAFGIVFTLLLGTSLVQAQQECTANLTAEECELYETAFRNFLSGGEYSFSSQISVTATHGLIYNRSLNFFGTGAVSISEAGMIDLFYYEADVTLHTSSNFDSTIRLRESQDWQFDYQDSMVQFKPEVGHFHWTSVDSTGLSIESILPVLSDAFQIENLLTKSGTSLGEESLIYEFYLASDFMADSPFASLQRLILQQEDLRGISGTGILSGAVAINPNTGALQGIALEQLSYLDFAREFPVILSVYYFIQFQESEAATDYMSNYALDTEFNAELDYGLEEYGILGLLSTAVSEASSNIFTPIGD
jgi:hypothetical protein